MLLVNDLKMPEIPSSRQRQFKAFTTIKKRTFDSPLFLLPCNKGISLQSSTTKMSAIFTSKFVKTIKTLSEEELKSFEFWLKSPWCNSNKNLIRLLEKLQKYYPTFDHKKLSKENLFHQVLPNGKFSDRRMNNLLSEGYLAAERFLVFYHVTKDENLQKELLSKELQSRYLDDWFFKEANKEIIRLAQQPTKEWEDHLQLFQMHRRVYHHPNQNPRMQPGSATIVKMDEELNLLYLLEKAAIINEKIFRNRILKNENHEVEKDLEQWILASEEINHISIDFYSIRFTYTEENMLEQYTALRVLFFKHFEALNRKEQKIHLLSLLNDTSFLIKATKLEITESLPLYKLGLQTSIILHQGQLTINTYVTIVSASNTEKDFTFTSQFIAEYTKSLRIEFQEEAMCWAKAHKAYWENNLKEGLEMLVQNDFKLLYFQRITKLLLTQFYFDLYLQDSSYQFYLLNFFDSFEKWLLREKHRATFNKKPYLRFVQVCRKLTKNYGGINFMPEDIRHLLDNENNIQASNWLQQKIVQIIELKE